MVIDFGFISNYFSPTVEAMPVFPDLIDLIRRVFSLNSGYGKFKILSN